MAQTLAQSRRDEARPMTFKDQFRRSVNVLQWSGNVTEIFELMFVVGGFRDGTRVVFECLSAMPNGKSRASKQKTIFSVVEQVVDKLRDCTHTKNLSGAKKNKHPTSDVEFPQDSRRSLSPALRCSSGAWALRLNERNIQYAFRRRRRFNEGNIERIEMSSGTIKSVEREHWTQSVVKWRAWLRFKGIIKQLNEAESQFTWTTDSWTEAN